MTPSTPVCVAQVILTLKLPPPVSRLRLCAMKSAVLSLLLTIHQRKRYVVRSSIIFLDLNDLQAFDTEMQSFFYLFTRYLAERAKSQDLYDNYYFRPLLLTPDTAIGIASSPQLKTRLCPTLTSRSPRILRTSTSLPCSKSMEGLAHPWV